MATSVIVAASGEDAQPAGAASAEIVVASAVSCSVTRPPAACVVSARWTVPG
ncbi:MAG: hypothetical protein WKF58_08500 [Ilumatobacteraceae bacterium]